MQRGIASDESRLSKPLSNPPKDLEWVQQEGKDVWVLQLNEEAEALEQAKEEQEKQAVIEENEKKTKEEAEKIGLKKNVSNWNVWQMKQY